MVTRGLPAVVSGLENVAREFQEAIEEEHTLCAMLTSVGEESGRATTASEIVWCGRMAWWDKPVRMAELR